MRLRVHGILERSLTNGPGERFVCWFQGCTIKCPDCFNPETHDRHGGTDSSTEALFDAVLAVDGISGVTISGGEPFDQVDALYDLLKRIRDNTSLNILVYSGYTPVELESSPVAVACLKQIDWLISGRFDRSLQLQGGPYGSSNQVLHELSGEPWNHANCASLEVQVDSLGEIVVTGFPGDWKAFG